MPLPQAIFIDTCIFDGEKYDFSSSQLQALITAAAGRNLKLLLPHPTKQEIARHIDEKAKAAIAALKSARHDNPLLSKVPTFPQSRADRDRMERALRDAVLADWIEFQQQFALRELDYSGVDLDEVMRWYQTGKPPFGTGEKRKEFPDAFAFVAIRNYAQQSGENVAVVSADNDFKGACAHITHLHYFPSLPTLTSALLADDAHFAAATAMAGASVTLLASRITAEFPDRGFDHTQDPNGRGYVDDVSVTNVNIEPDDLTIIGVGHREFTIAFTATVQFTAHVEYDDPDSWVSGDPGDDVMYLHHCKGVVADEIEISGTARISTDESWSTAGEIAAFEIEEDSIEVNTEAPQSDEPGDYDYEPAEAPTPPSD